MKNSRVTIKQISERTGVSIGTVDRALSNRSGISEKTKEKVLAAAKELGYTRNHIASALSRKKKYKIGVISSIEPIDFYKYIDRGVDRAKEDFLDYGVEVETIKSERLGQEEQAKLLEKLDYKQYDGIVINAAGKATSKYINRMIDDGVVVATFNSDASDSKRLFFVGNDAELSGRLAGELMGDYLGGAGNAVVVGNFINTDTFAQRFGGFNQQLQQDYPEIGVQLLAERYDAPDIAKELVTDLLNKNKNIKGIFATGYTITVGAIKALEETGAKGIKLIGYDLSPEIINGIKSGICAATIFQEPYNQAYQAVRQLSRYLLGEWSPKEKELFVETKIILKSNVDNYSVESFDHDPFR